MSIKVMSSVFEYDMPNLKTEDGKTVPDSTAKFVLLALADHCNEEGEGAYPGVDRICKKTSMSTSTVCNALNALRFNGYTTLEGKSKAETNNYTINTNILRISATEISATEIEEFQPPKSERFSHRNESVIQPSDKPSRETPKKKKDYLDLLAEQAGSEATRKGLQISDMYDRMDKGFRTSFARNSNTDTVVKFILLQETKGDSLDRFISWANRDEFNASRTWEYAENPIKIKTRWQVAMSEIDEELDNTYHGNIDGV